MIVGTPGAEKSIIADNTTQDGWNWTIYSDTNGDFFYKIQRADTFKIIVSRHSYMLPGQANKKALDHIKRLRKAK